MDNAHSRFHVASHPGRVRINFKYHELADSDDVIGVAEEGGEPVFFFPANHVQLSSMQLTGRTAEHEHFGLMRYYSIYRDGLIIEDVAYTVDDPRDGFGAIAGRIAFNPKHVDIYENPGEARGEDVRHVPAHDPPYADSKDGRTV